MLKIHHLLGTDLVTGTKALERFDTHEKSDMDHEATERLQLRGSSIHVGCMLDTKASPEQEFHGAMLLKLLRKIKFF